MPITCPYCFSVFDHSQVHFRSERVSRGECDAIPVDFDDFQDFQLNYRGPEAKKAEIIRQYEEWEFFREREDEMYTQFWKNHGGTTTEKVTPQKASYRNRVINPALQSHRRYLKNQGRGENDYVIYQNGFAHSIILRSGEICTQRVCPECHNPLPTQYGRNECRFIAVIGVTGAGKTVYLSRLIYNFEDYVAKVGMAALPTSDSPLQFLREYAVNTRVELPGSTPSVRFLQPLFYDLRKEDEQGRVKIYTLVLYDVAGENCDREKGQLWFRSNFITHIDGIFLLIDPLQFRVIQGLKMDEDGNEVDITKATTALHAIQEFLNQGGGGKCTVPLAVCIAKSDMEVVQEVLDDDLVDALTDEVEAVADAAGDSLPQFNASAYNPIAVALHNFIREQEAALTRTISTGYSCYNYFAFSSLGCGVTNNIPDGPILSKRIEEPLLWLFHKFGFIGADEEVVEYGDPCPVCRNTLHRKRLFGDARFVMTKKALLKKNCEWTEYNYFCSSCSQYY